ncbi:quinon protein alcohol dehydrogenase-like superfamily [Suillus ampliporus]|nr:quinon protein alcohol dehydrogenase-like superfamily [Suillus ampliporus]
MASESKPTRQESLTPAQAKGPTPKHKFEGHEKAIWSFVFLHDNVHIVSGAEDGTMRKWNCNTGRLVGTPWKGKGGSIYALALSPDGKTIACGRWDGSVQRWKTNGEMMEGVWTGNSDGRGVWSLSWSPSGSHIAIGSEDGTILIRETESGKVKVGPIETKQGCVRALAYSPSDDRIASGGGDQTICVWDSKTGKLVIGPISNLGNVVTSVVWSRDSSKFYSASDKFARVFDGNRGTLLIRYRFKHGHNLYSVALSPKNNTVLACVGVQGVAKLWDTESLQPLSQSFGQDQVLHCVSFSRDGRYIAYGGDDRKLTLWTVKDILVPPQLPAPIPQRGHKQGTETRPESSSSSCLEADATAGDVIIEEGYDGPHDNSFQQSDSQPSMSAPPHSNPTRHFWKTISRHRPPANESIPLRERRMFFARRAHSKSPLQHATTTPNEPTPEGNGRAGEEDIDLPDVSSISALGPYQPNMMGCQCSANAPLGARSREKEKGKQREETLAGGQTLPSELDRKETRTLLKPLHVRGKDSDSAEQAPAKKCDPPPKVVEIRGSQGKRKAKSLAVTSAPATAAHPINSVQTGPCSQGGSAQAGASLQPVSVQACTSHGTSGHGAQRVQVTGGPSPHVSQSQLVPTYHTDHDSDSRSSIKGTCNRFLAKICFPRRHLHRDSSREHVD